MAALTALILWTLTVSSSTAGTYSPFEGVNVDLSSYQDPWPIINNTQVIYLARMSGTANATKPCVKSRHWGYQSGKKTVHRSLEVGSTNVSSTNISLSVRYENETEANLTMLEVYLNASAERAIEATIPGANGDRPSSDKKRTFVVLFGDEKCLLLGNPLSEHVFTNCSLWFPHKTGWLSPPVCCEYLFLILCGEGTKVDLKSCQSND